MRVLFINGVFPVLSQTFVLDHIKGFLESESNVEVLARKKSGFQFEDSIPECDDNMLYIKPVNTKLFYRCIKGYIKRPLKSTRLVSLRLQKKIHAQTLIAYLQLQDEPDVMITHFGNNYAISTQLKRYALPNAVNVIIFHGHDVTSYIEKNGWNNYRKVEKYIDYALCVNNHFADLLKKNTNIKDVRCLYLGTNLPEIKRKSHRQKVPQLLFVGRLVEKKGLIYLILACKVLRSKGVSFKLHIIGDGPLRTKLQNEVIQAELTDYVVFYGAQQHNFILDMMSKCDIFVLPSVVAENKDSEGLPVVIMEAMNAGMLVISTYHSGIPELVQDGINGFLVREGDFVNLAKVIEKAFNLKVTTKEALTNQAKKDVEAQHSKLNQVQELITLVESGEKQ